MSKQKVFNIVKEHLLKQNEQSLSENKTCMYRGNYDLKCAMGVLIPDNLYKSQMEECTIDSILEDFPELKKHFDSFGFYDLEFYGGLQGIHDGSFSNAKDFAEHHDLEF